MTNVTIERITKLNRMNNSVNGNPKYGVEFDSGKLGITSSDHGFCYGLTNRENFNCDVRVTWTRSGRVSNIEPVSDYEARQDRIKALAQ